MRIWKYPCNLPSPGLDTVVEFKMPQGATVIHIGQQSHAKDWRVAIWADVDVDAPTEIRCFLVTRTGSEIPPGATYVGTAQTHQGYRVWHIFELPMKAEETEATPDDQH